MSEQNEIQTKSEKKMLSVKECAEYFGVSEKWVRARVKSRELKYFRMGLLIKFNIEDLEKYKKKIEVRAVA